MSDVVIRPVDGTVDLEAFVRLRNALDPDEPTSLDEIRWEDATYAGGVRLVAERAGHIVGTASVGRIFMYPEDHARFWATVEVEPPVRRQGIGSRLLDALSQVARAAGKTGLETVVREDRPESMAFLEHRGFSELERDRMVRLELADLDRPEVVPPDGIALTTLADRPELLPGIHAVAVEAFPSIPGGDTRVDAGTLEEFRARDIERPGIPTDGFVVALDEVTGNVVGYASLIFKPGSETLAWHDMTAVRRAWQGRGIARALKIATIAWAIDHGLEALETGNNEDNGPMRAINLRLGYEPLPDEITYVGPLYRLPAG